MVTDIETGDRPEKLGIREVAALAGVSHMTVSRVLNGHPNIRPATRQRVLDVIQQLDFKPNSAARALATQRTQRIGVIVDSSVEFGPGIGGRSARIGGWLGGTRGAA